MFEDSTFESTGRIKTRSRRWMLATLAFNGAILVTLVLIPLIYPNALPSHMIPSLLVAPPALQPERPHPPPRTRDLPHNNSSEIENGRIIAPPRIPTVIRMMDGPERPFNNNIAMDAPPGVPGADGPFAEHMPVKVVHPDVPRVVHVPSSLSEGLLVYKSIPQYPVIPKTLGMQGTVVLQATISKSGTIENLRAISGPALLQQAAIDAVKTWRYRPYMLNKEPVEVETTVSVIFKLDR